VQIIDVRPRLVVKGDDDVAFLDARLIRRTALFDSRQENAPPFVVNNPPRAGVVKVPGTKGRMCGQIRKSSEEKSRTSDA
jgi:hypothetical protein